MPSRLLLALGLAAAAALLYARAAGFEFVALDDDVYVTANRHVAAGLTWEGVRWAFSLAKDHGGNWHPLTSLAHMLDVELFGLEPAGHHAVNALWHVLDTLLVFGFLEWTTRERRPAAFAAALFALHPLHVESVAWVSERKDVLSTACGLAALWTWAAWTRKGGAARYLGALALLAAGLMSKPMLVSWPLVMLLCDVWPLGRWPGTRPARLVLEKLPFFALAAVSGAVTFLVQRAAGAMPAGALVPLSERLANAPVACVLYLWKAVWPADLAVLYPHAYGQGGTPWAAWQVAGALLVLAVLTALATRRRYLAAGWLWYLVTLAPVIGIVQVGSQGMADRYTYVPLIGPSFALAWGCAELVRRAGLPRARAAAGALAALVLAALAACAWRQLGHWRDSLALFEHAVRVAPRSLVARLNLAHELDRLGRGEAALAEARAALAIAPGMARAHSTLGVLHHRRGELDLAVSSYREALELDPLDADARHNLGGALRQLGRWDEAELVYRRWLAIDPRSADACYGIGAAQVGRGELEAAIASLRRALELAPDHASALAELGYALLTAGRPDEAADALRRALAADPGLAFAHANLGAALEAQGLRREALEHFRAAARSDPAWAALLEERMRALAAATGDALPP